MGDHTWWQEDCPKCKGHNTVEGHDAWSSMQHSLVCSNCDYNDGLDYYETDDNTIELLTKEEAKERGIKTY